MKSKIILIFLSINSFVLFSQVPLPYAGLQEAYDVNYYDTTGMIWLEYTSSGKDAVRTQQSWRAAQKKWLNQQRYLTEYNSKDLVDGRLTFDWNLGTNQWDTTDRMSIKYDANNQIIEQKIDLYSNLSWIILSIDSVFYGSNGKKSINKVYWTDSPTTYTYSGQHLFTYDSNDSLSGFLYLWLNNNGIDWDTVARYTYTYNTTQRVDTTVWENYTNTLGWEYVTKDMMHYDASGKRTKLLSHHWDNSLNDWKNAVEVLYTYHSDESIDQQTQRNWDDVEKDYLPLFRTTYLYGSPIGIQNKKSSNNIVVFPNPVDDRIIIQTGGDKSATPIRILSETGNLIYQGMLSGGQETLNVSNWTSGIYLVLIGEGSKAHVERIIKK